MAETSAVVETFTASDGYRWHYRRYEPSGPARAHVVCLHGIQSHGGWYGHSCAALAEAGFRVSFLDRRGSGLNQQDRGDTPSFRRLLDDIAEYLHHLRGPEVQPSVGLALPAVRSTTPVFLMAVSWGGKLAAALPNRHPGLIDGLLLLCPGLFPQVAPSWGSRLGICAARLTNPRRPFPIPLNDPELFTAVPRWQEFIRTDPLALHQATARLLIESVRLDIYLRRCPKSVTMPLLLVLAGKDRIIANGPTRAFAERCATPVREVIEYPEAHHTLEFEPDPERWLGDVRRWLLERVAK